MATHYTDVCIAKGVSFGGAVEEKLGGLFTGEDKKLPILTRVYQLRGLNHTRTFYIEEGQSEEDAAILRGEEEPYDSILADAIKALPQEVETFASLCQLVQSVMENIGEGIGPTSGQMEELADWQKKFCRVLLAQTYRFPDEHLRPGELVYKLLIDPTLLGNTPVCEKIVRNMVLLVERYNEGEETLRKCEECHNWFILRNHDAKLCSRRCAARVGERRRRAKKKNP